MKRLLFNVLLVLPALTGQAADAPSTPFEPTDVSLARYQCPEWFRDAKFGIWSHWGPVAAPGGFGGNWYARQMYVQGSRENLHHVATRGHPSKFGYKNIIELWKAEKFDPDRLMDLYVKAGAKYFVSMGAHHDNFDLWDSKRQEWNAVNHGPKKDIVGLWRDAARKRGLRFGVSEHFARSYNWMQRSHGSDTNGPMAGVPYDGADPKYARLYGPPHGDASAGYPTNPPATWTREWFDRMQDLVHAYQPDLVYSDGGIPFGAVGRNFMADFYNANLKANDGRLEAVYTIKKGRDVGDFIEGAAVQDEENTVLAGIKDQPWQTDASIGTWFFVPDLEPRWRRSGPDVIVMLADIVAKNGNLLLNIPQRGDGTIDAEAEQVLADLAAWMTVNGEAIFATRPWKVHGEGPALTAAGRGIKRAADYTAADIRFTRSKDGSTLYAIALGWPAGGKLEVRSLAKAAGPIRDVLLLGHAGALPWKQDDDGLEVTLPSQKPCETAFALKIIGPDLKPAPTTPARDPIRAFCVDFNWGPGGPNGFAPPGLWADADPARHVAWYAALGANVIQTFAVSCNGYAWYKGGTIPAQPGLKHDFLPEVARLGHAKGMKVMGYFCAGANTRWGTEHPDLSYGAPSAYHIPFTDAYLDHLAASIEEALLKSGMDGFMVDWLWNPSDKVRNGKWLPAEEQLFKQLTGHPFPGENKLTADAKLDYERRAIDRCWERIRSTAKRVKPDCVIWLSCNRVGDPTIAGSRVLREVDWMMDESGTPAALRSVAPMLGPQTRPVLCVVGWGDRHDARTICADAANADFGIYGFSRPNPDSLPLPVERYLAEPPESFKGNDRNIAVIARFFNGRPIVPGPDKPGPLVDDRVDWPAFLERLDPVWEILPDQFDHGAFLGNGLLGATIYREGERGLRWEMGRTDVTEHRRDNNRLPIGGLVLETGGRILSGTMRLDLLNAEVRGEVTTEKGAVRFRSLVHTHDPALLIECEFDGDERGAKFAWNPGHGQDRRNLDRFRDPPNPPAVTETNEGLPVCVQPRHAGGEFATAWLEAPAPAGRRVILSVADSFPGNTARRDAAAAVRAFAAADPAQRIAAHRAWWHAVYPRSFVSVPDPRLESFYWIQIYKLASASRPDRGPVDLLGPWFRDTSWPRIWWNLNIQTLYLPVYTANQLELGESLVRFLDAKRDNFARNAKAIWKIDDGATVPHTTDREGLRGDGSCAPDHFINPGDFTWALHNYWLHYRHSMDHALVTNQAAHALYPLLKGSVNVYLSLLKKGDDGRLHLPVLHSPEYGNAADNNYNLALLRWGCRTLLDLDRRYALNDTLAPRWREVMDTLADPPVDENGLRIGSDTAVSKSHRHWSQMLMAHPLHTMALDDPAQRELLQRSIRHWLTVDGGRGIYGWSMAAAASLHAALGDGDRAIESIHRHLDDARFVRPNTMYIEGSPVIECSIVLARSLQDMLLQSHGGTLRVFPAAPGAWKDAVFHNLRAEGAFLVSAERKDGAVRWVRVRSLAGEPCRIRPGFSAGARVRSAPAGARLTPLGGGAYELNLARGSEALLFAGEDPGMPVVKPLAISATDAHPYGVKAPVRGPPQQGTFRASSEWGKGYEAGQAFDGDESTRWGAAPGSRSGWIEVDLGRETAIGRAVVMEIGFPRTEKFAIEFREGENWKPLVSGAGLRGKQTFDFAPVRARVFRLHVLEASEVPTIEEFHLLEK